MALWSIVVLGVLKTGLNLDWDRLEFHVRDSKLVRQMMGLGAFDDEIQPSRQTLIDNVSLLTPELLKEINDLVIQVADAKVLRKKSGESFQARADSFVVETDVHHPTDVSLLWDAMRSSWTRTA